MVTFSKAIARRGSIWGRRNPGPLVVPPSALASTADWSLYDGIMNSTGTPGTIAYGGLKGVMGSAQAARFTKTFSGKQILHVFLYTDAAPGATIGIANAAMILSNYVGATADGYGLYAGDGKLYNNGGGGSVLATYAAGDVISIAFDTVNGKLWIGKNSTWLSSGDPVAGTNALVSGLVVAQYPAIGSASGTSTTISSGKFAGF